MKNLNRDLLVLFNQELMTPGAMEHEVELLHEMLFHVERLDNLVVAHEVIDLNKYSVSNKYKVLSAALTKRELKPFVFLNNKN